MFSEYSLFDRLESSEKNRQSYSTKLDEAKLYRSIMSNVQSMLNVRQGSVLALDDYGMPDFSQLVSIFPDAINKIRAAIRAFIIDYEPRLKNISVIFVEDPDQPLRLTFQVVGDVYLRDSKQKLKFNTILTGAGQATIRG